MRSFPQTRGAGALKLTTAGSELRSVMTNVYPKPGSTHQKVRWSAAFPDILPLGVAGVAVAHTVSSGGGGGA